jgi:hypothetical protein
VGERVIFYGWLGGKRVLVSMTTLGKKNYSFYGLPQKKMRGERQEGRKRSERNFAFKVWGFTF